MDGWTYGNVSLAECEYTVTSTGWNYSVCHGGNYYVKAGYNGDAKPQKAELVKLHIRGMVFVFLTAQNSLAGAWKSG